MAHYKRGKCRVAGKATRSRRNQISPMRPYPRWHDIIFHHRPHRRRTRALERLLVKGGDPDAPNWPLRRKPHKYYW